MKHTIRVYLGVGLSFVCRVCQQETLPPSYRNTLEQNPEDPDRFKICVCCYEEVPYSIRRTKSYQRRWDERNAINMWEEIQFLRTAAGTTEEC